MTNETKTKYRVLGGHLAQLGTDEPDFATPENLEIIGDFDTYCDAYDAWKSAAFATIDDAHMRYIIQDAQE